MRTLIADIKAKDGETVEVCGFVKQVRDLKKMQFIVVRDVTEAVQCTVFKTPENEKLNAEVAALNPESSVKITGKVHVDDFVKMNGVEVLVESIEVVAPAKAMLPIDLTDFNESNRDKRLDWRFLDLRTKEHQLIFRTQTIAEMAMREFWIKNSFIEIHSPKIVGNPSESGAELFELEYFDRKAYLAQSPQFYKQMAISSGFERVFEIGPVFRANSSHTTRHDTEFTSVDTEIAWIDSFEDIMRFEEHWLAYVIGRVKEVLGDEIKKVFDRDIVVPTVPFPRVTMEEAKEIIKSMDYVVPPETKGDLDPTAERLLGKYAKEKFGSEFIFVTEFPTSIRPFYHMYKAGDPSKTCSYDLLWNGLEVTTGAQREHRLEYFLRQGIEKGVLPKNCIDKSGALIEENVPQGMKAYVSLFEYGCPPHGGYGFGLTRMLMNLLGYGNVREVTYVYRGVDRLYP